ncbi:MAG: glycosyltransferase family 2 protein [Chloroflexi bacterium]|nr:glycosyltransferase family 2 protein [Chloroflexota bacterium]MCC6894156.1 glycosyltransferase family 2 protein [Anaerolineae bacterium]
MKLSIVIPARNEEGNIGKTLHLLSSHLDGAGVTNFEILVVDDGSKDRTNEIVQAENARDPRIRVVRNTGRNGFGRAVTVGLNNFTGEAVIVYMADASDAPEDVVRYYHILRDEADCAFGSRFMRESKVYDYPRFKLVINRIANFAIRSMFSLRYNDVTNAFKGYRRNVIEGCRPFVSPHFNLTIEIPLKAIVRGYSYKTLPITWRNRDIGESALKLKEQGSRYLYTLLTVWFEYLLVSHDTRRTDSGEFVPWRAEDAAEAEHIARQEK